MSFGRLAFAAALSGCGGSVFPTGPSSHDDADAETMVDPGPEPADVDAVGPPWIELGRSLGCVPLSDALSCWGGSGIVPVADDGAPQRFAPAGPRSLQRVAIGSRHACVIAGEGAVRCWGNNDYGQLGLGDDRRREAEIDVMADVPLPRPVLDLVAGEHHTCALDDADQVRCWGETLGTDGDPDLRVGDAPGEVAAEPPVAFGTTFHPTSLAGGDAHVCALDREGRVACWGDNAYGELGLGDRRSRTAGTADPVDGPGFVDLGPDRTATAIAAGARTTCAILDDASLKCWGGNAFGQLGTGDSDARGDEPGEMGADLLPINLGDRDVEQVEVGELHVCARFSSGGLACWGHNDDGALGLGHTENVGDDPHEMGAALVEVELGQAGPALHFACGARTTCAILEDATTRCWGRGIGDEPEEMGDALPVIDP